MSLLTWVAPRFTAAITRAIYSGFGRTRFSVRKKDTLPLTLNRCGLGWSDYNVLNLMTHCVSDRPWGGWLS